MWSSTRPFALTHPARRTTTATAASCSSCCAGCWRAELQALAPSCARSVGHLAARAHGRSAHAGTPSAGARLGRGDAATAKLARHHAHGAAQADDPAHVAAREVILNRIRAGQHAEE